MNRKIKKEFILLILIILVVAFILGILFYDVLPTDETIVSKQYEFGENVTATINEINATNSDLGIEEDSVLKSYKVTQEDLNEYTSANSYERGKKDPFAESADPVDSTMVKTKVKEAERNVSHSNQTEEKTNKEDAVNTLTQMNIVSNTTNETKVENKNNKFENKANNDKVENTTVKNETSTGRFFEKPNSK